MVRLIIGQQHGCLPYVIAIVSALSVGNPFIQDYQLEDKLSDADSDEDEEIAQLQNEAAIEKAKRKLMRKKYFGALTVTIESYFKRERKRDTYSI